MSSALATGLASREVERSGQQGTGGKADNANRARR